MWPAAVLLVWACTQHQLMATAAAAAAHIVCPAVTCVCETDYLQQQQQQDDGGEATGQPATAARIPITMACPKLSGDSAVAAQLPHFTASAAARVAIREARLSGMDLRALGAGAFRTLETATPQSLLLNDNLIELVDVDAFGGIEQGLEELDLSHNRLTQLPFLTADISVNGRFPNLRKLNVADNWLTSIDGASLGRGAPVLVDLTLSENRLTSVEFLVDARLATLELLNVGSNRIQQFSSSALLAAPRLRSLLAADNQLSRIGFLEAGGAAAATGHPLDVLVLLKNRIHSVDGDALAAFRRLTVLDMAQNELESAQFLQVAAASGGLQSLKELFLASNRLTTLQSCWIAPLKALTDLDYQENPMECGCDVQWLRDASQRPRRTTHSKCAATADGASVGYSVEQFPLPVACSEQPDADTCRITDRQASDTMTASYLTAAGRGHSSGVSRTESAAVAVVLTNAISAAMAISSILQLPATVELGRW